MKCSKRDDGGIFLGGYEKTSSTYAEEEDVVLLRTIVIVRVMGNGR